MYQQAPQYKAPVYRRTAKTDGLCVALADAKEFLILADDSRDAEITAFIKAAQAAVEQYCGIDLLSATYEATMPALPPALRLAKRPFGAITAFAYYDADNAETAMEADLYLAQPGPGLAGEVHLEASSAWPAAAKRADAFTLTFTAGFGATSADIPVDIQHAILMIVAKLDMCRGDCEKSGGRGTFQYYSGGSGFSVPAPGDIIPPEAQASLRPYIWRGVVLA